MRLSDGAGQAAQLPAGGEGEGGDSSVRQQRHPSPALADRLPGHAAGGGPDGPGPVQLRLHLHPHPAGQFGKW